MNINRRKSNDLYFIRPSLICWKYSSKEEKKKKHECVSGIYIFRFPSFYILKMRIFHWLSFYFSIAFLLRLLITRFFAIYRIETIFHKVFQASVALAEFWLCSFNIRTIPVAEGNKAFFCPLTNYTTAWNFHESYSTKYGELCSKNRNECKFSLKNLNLLTTYKKLRYWMGLP